MTITSRPLPEKLAGPDRRVRFVLGADRLRVVVGGIFPPENAGEIRDAWELVVPLIEPKVRAAFEEAQRHAIDELMYGRPGAPEPQGVLRGEHWLGVIA